MKMFYHLVAVADHNIINLENLPPLYTQYFPQVTQDHTVIISKKAFEAFGQRMLAKKIMIVSRTTMTLEDAMTETQEEEFVFIAGGATIYQRTMAVVNGLYIAKIDAEIDGNVFYPKIPDDMRLRFQFPLADKVAMLYYERDWKSDES